MVVSVTFRTLQARLQDGQGTEQKLRAYFSRETRRKLFFGRFLCPLVLLFPLALSIALFGLTYFLAGIVFAIQATVVGSDTYKSDVACEHTIGKWLLIYGCLGIVTTALSCCGRSTRANPDGTITQAGALPIESLASFAQFSWLVYGVTILFRNEDELRPCNTSQWGTFSFMVKFMFYGMIALFAAITLLFCMGIPVLRGLLEELERFTEEERPILTESMLESGEGDRLSAVVIPIVPSPTSAARTL